ncbi:MAG: RNA polymerase sigma factor [Pseudomonadota bacterium]
MRALQQKQQDPDIALLEATARGETAAFERLHRRYYRKVFGFSLRITGRMETAEEVVSDTMMVVWRKADTFMGQSRPSTWIFGIAYRIAMKARGKGARETLHDEIDEEHAADRTGPQEIETLFERKRILAALGRLPAEQRAAMELTYYHGYTMAEIAEVQECPVGTVKTRMFHARAKLRAMLETDPGQKGGLV